MSKWILADARVEDGSIVKRFTKELIKVGSYVKESDDIDFEITAETLKHWVATFGLMKTNGIKVPIPEGHTYDADKNRGYLIELEIKKDALIGTIELIGQDAVELATRNDVSIFSPPEWIDGKGNKYTRPIIHVAITSYPVIPGLKEFEAIAASLFSGDLMPKTTKKELKLAMDFERFGEALGIAEELTDENAEELIMAKIVMLREQRDMAKEEVAKLQAEIAKSAGGDEPTSDEIAASNATLFGLQKDNRKMKIDHLVERGNITPAVAKKLIETYTSNDALALSMNGSDSFDSVLSAMAENDPVVLKEKTGAQSTLTLAKTTVNEDGDNVLVADAKKRAEK